MPKEHAEVPGWWQAGRGSSQNSYLIYLTYVHLPFLYSSLSLSRTPEPKLHRMWQKALNLINNGRVSVTKKKNQGILSDRRQCLSLYVYGSGSGSGETAQNIQCLLHWHAKALSLIPRTHINKWGVVVCTYQSQHWRHNQVGLELSSQPNEAQHTRKNNTWCCHQTLSPPLYTDTDTHTSCRYTSMCTYAHLHTHTKKKQP